MYIRASKNAESRGATGHRQRLLAGLSGSVVEVGAGSGLNFPHYPESVTDVIAVEPEPTLRAEASASPPPSRAHPGRVRASPRTCRSGMRALTPGWRAWCCAAFPDQARAIAEIRRVLRPGGELRFYEHVIPNSQPKRAMLQIADHSGLWPLIAGGCHPARDTGAAIEAGRFSGPEQRADHVRRGDGSNRRSRTSWGRRAGADHARRARATQVVGDVIVLAGSARSL